MILLLKIYIFEIHKSFFIILMTDAGMVIILWRLLTGTGGTLMKSTKYITLMKPSQ